MRSSPISLTVPSISAVTVTEQLQTRGRPAEVAAINFPIINKNSMNIYISCAERLSSAAAQAAAASPVGVEKYRSN